MKIPFAELGLPRGYRVVANIPYYLTARLLRLLLTGEHQPRDMLLMVQREVAERIVARPPRMNLLALSVQAYGDPKIIFDVPRSAFSPRPKVDSAFIRIGNINKEFFTSRAIDEEKFFTVLRAAFRGKRKVLENTLSKNLKLPKLAVAEVLASLTFSGKRPEELSPAEWGKLVRAIGRLA